MAEPGPAATTAPAHADLAIAARLRDGDERAFAAFAALHHAALVRFASARLGSAQRAIAEEAAQEAWVVFLERLEGYEARSSLRTFLFGILVHVLHNRARAEARSVPFSAIEGDDDAPALSADRFLAESETWAGHWSAAPAAWRVDPVESREIRAILGSAIEALPPAQREIVVLRDVMGWSAEEACNTLGLSDIHQRVLLHRARSRLRAILELHLGA
jgi:RNA polymerase sigma-70 factor, ECF subfamily